MAERADIRNVAIIAHVDHGKTTLVDAMLRQSGVFQAHEEVTDRVMDSMDQERERGITILAKNAAVRYTSAGGDVKLNLVDTPGHADFGGEVERGLTMVDGVMLLVDASEGPLPQTRFVLRKALERAPAGDPLRQQGRPPGRAHRRGRRRGLRALPRPRRGRTSRSSSRSSTRTRAPARRRTSRASRARTCGRSSTCSCATCRPPTYEEGHPLQALVTNLDASSYVGRLALCRVHNGHDPQGRRRLPGAAATARSSAPAWPSSTSPRASTRVAARGGRPGRDRSPSRASPRSRSATRSPSAEDPRPLPPIAVDEPALGMTIGINSSPLAGQSGKQLTARMVRDRLDQELVGNVSIRVLDTDRPDTWEVQGRGELQLGVLVEAMRREGFELTVGKPQVVTREVDGKLHEPSSGSRSTCPRTTSASSRS